VSRAVVDALRARMPGAILDAGEARGDTFVVVRREDWLAAATLLRDDPACRMDHFVDLTCVDWPDREGRFDVVLHLRSSALGHRVRVKTRAGGAEPRVASLAPLFKGADWFEREAFDMYGVVFEGHPDLRRILLFESFNGHPLRKDYPKTARQYPMALREDAPPQPPPFRERR